MCVGMHFESEYHSASLAELLPQASPMILLSGYDEPVEENAVESFVDITSSSPFFEAAARGVPGCVTLEYMAQTMALLVGLVRRKSRLPPKLGFVLGSRRLTVRLPYFKEDERYRVRAVCTYQDEEFGSFDCVITDMSGECVAEGTVTAFQPSGEMTAEKLKNYL